MTDPTRPMPGYPTKPANQNYCPHAQPQPPRATPTFTSILLVFLVIFTIIFFITLPIIVPHVPILTVDSLSLTSLNLSTTSEISATWTVNFTVTNPNKIFHAYYDKIEAWIFYNSSQLALKQLPPIDLVTKSQSSVVAKLVAVLVYIPQELVRRFEGDRKNGVVKFDVQVLVLVRYGSGVCKVRNVLSALCDDLSVSVSSSAPNGNFSGGSRRCVVSNGDKYEYRGMIDD